MMIKNIMLVVIILSSCQLPPKDCYILMGQSNACPVLAAELQKNTNIKVFQIYHPGDEIERWYTETQQINANTDITFIMDKARFYNIKAVFWFQGESNMYDQYTQDEYYNYTCNYFDRLISLFGNIDINIFKVWYTGADPNVIINREIIRSEQDRLCAKYPGVIIDGSNYPYRDLWHMTDAGYEASARDIIYSYEN